MLPSTTQHFCSSYHFKTHSHLASGFHCAFTVWQTYFCKGPECHSCLHFSLHLNQLPFLLFFTPSMSRISLSLPIVRKLPFRPPWSFLDKISNNSSVSQVLVWSHLFVLHTFVREVSVEIQFDHSFLWLQCCLYGVPAAF